MLTAEATTGTEMRAMTPLELQMHADSDWAMRHYEELDRQYRGEYIVIWKKQVIAHGSDGTTLLEQATAAGYPQEELVLVAIPEPFVDIAA